MKNSSYSKAVTSFERECQKHGFTKSGANLYRVWGDGLLQVITARGFPERVNNVAFLREQAVCFGVYSLYSRIPWNPVEMRPKRDLIPGLLPGVIEPNGENNEFRGTVKECESAKKYVIPYLNELQTHQKLIDFYAAIDYISDAKANMLDRSRISPYLLTGNTAIAVEIIDAIERQNWDAYHVNKLTAGYDGQTHYCRIKQRLAPLIALRDGIAQGNKSVVRSILNSAYTENAIHLNNIGIHVDNNHISNMQFLF